MRVTNAADCDPLVGVGRLIPLECTIIKASNTFPVKVGFTLLYHQEIRKHVDCPSREQMTAVDRVAPPDAPAACCVCAKNELTCIVWPCAHRCLCARCARTLAMCGKAWRGQVACPLCGEQVKKIKIVY